MRKKMRFQITLANFAPALFVLLTSTVANAQADKPVARDQHLTCAGATLAGITMSKDSSTGYRALLSYFLISASALDPSNPPKEAAADAGRSALATSKNWIDAIAGPKGTEEEKTQSVEKFKAEINRCVAIYSAYRAGADSAP